MNHKINHWLRTLPDNYRADGADCPSQDEPCINNSVCSDRNTYWGLIKLNEPIAGDFLSFCLYHEKQKYDMYEPQD